MTTILTNSPTTRRRESRPRIWNLKRAPQLSMRAMVFISLGAVITVLMAWALGLWADVDSATVITSTVPHRGRTWELSIWNSSGAMRLHSVRQVLSWSGWHVTGAPDSPMSGDSAFAWCPATADSQVEWLVLDYPRPMVAKIVQIYENYYPGAVNRVTVFKDNGEEIEAWRGQDPTSKNSAAGVSNIHIDIPFKIQRLKIYLDSPNTPGWNEIDAVGLIDQEGNRQWACDVQESSSYANLNVTPLLPLTLAESLPSWCPLAQPDKPSLNKPASANATDDRTFEARGWPMLALWAERPGNNMSNSPNPKRLSGASISPRFLPAATPGTLPPILPTHPIWGGLLFDTIFFAVLLAIAYWVLVRPRRFVVELLRMRRGCCIACGYELDFDFRSGCPECGWRRNPL